jgi:hypothetical protein
MNITRKNHMKRNDTNLTMNQINLADWIKQACTDGLMLTISRPHAKANHLQVEAIHMEPIIANIVRLANQFVFGKHKRFEYLKGMVVCEHWPLFPHFHIVFQKPVQMELDAFEFKLTQLATRLDDPNFKFDVTGQCRFFDPSIHKMLTTPCYPGFVHVSRAHERLGAYLTAEHAKYFLLCERGFSLDRDRLDVFVDFHNKQPDKAKEIANAKHLFQSRRTSPVQLQMVPMAHTTNA